MGGFVISSNIAEEVIKDVSGVINASYRNMEYGKYCSVFASTRENLEAVSKLANFQGKKVLLPISSGDQYFNAVFRDAKEVMLYDINKVSQYYIKLKIAALEYYEDKEDFIEFMLSFREKPAFAFSEIQKFNLESSVFTFWNEIFAHDKILYPNISRNAKKRIKF
jgi:hypothetical protein